ncbi:uncharacterized protein LOC122512602 [Leptopilina heterotoma]|uniref:uncharacterized protein LOC122512602 n=1 Tax=Leptopilina heterotoma TaxID=63436 RepID=UPI001CA97642|nr:uncharacterized protein LOC122512602 [Leptopilina heterotoma]
MENLPKFTILTIFVLIAKNFPCVLCENKNDNCGGTFSGYQYSIISPNYPGNYPANLNCTYYLRGMRQARCEQEFHLQFLDLNIRATEKCENDFLQIGESNIYCGRSAAMRVFKGMNNVLKIHFHSGKEIGTKGFRILVTTLPCVNTQNKNNTGYHPEIGTRQVTQTENVEKSINSFHQEKMDKTLIDKHFKSLSNHKQETVETLSPIYPSKIKFPDDNNNSDRKNFSRSLLDSSTYLFLPPTENSPRNFTYSQYLTPERNFSLPIFSSIPFRVEKSGNKLSSKLKNFSSNGIYGLSIESRNEVGYGIGSGTTLKSEITVENTDLNFDSNHKPGISDNNFGPGINYKPGVSDNNFGPGISEDNFGHGINYKPGVSDNNFGPGISEDNFGHGINYKPGVSDNNFGHKTNYNKPGISVNNFGHETNYNPGVSGNNCGHETNYKPGVSGNNFGHGYAFKPNLDPNPANDVSVNFENSFGTGSNFAPNGVGTTLDTNFGFFDNGNINSVNVNSLSGSGISAPHFSNLDPNLNSENIIPKVGFESTNSFVGYLGPDISSSGIFPGLPNYPSWSRPVSECCGPKAPSPRTFISSPGFPKNTFSSNSFECGYTIRKLSFTSCRLRLNFKFFNFGNEDPFCRDGSLIIGGKKFCGCKTGLSLVFPFDNLQALLINVRYNGFPKSKFSGFLIELIQEVCDYPFIQNRQGSNYKFGEELKTIQLENNGNELEDSKELLGNFSRTNSRGDYFYSGQNDNFGNFNLQHQSTVGQNEKLFLNSCENRAFLDWIVAARDAFFTGAKCYDLGNSGKLLNFVHGKSIWNGVQGNCEEITAVQGVITSPFYPNQYPNNLRKCYRFYRAPGFCRLEVSFLDFYLEPSFGCAKDNLMFSGQNKRYCGSSLLGTTTFFDLSQSRVADIYFVTDAIGSGKGFSIDFVQRHC